MFTESKPENDTNSAKLRLNTLSNILDDQVPGFSGEHMSGYNTGDYVLVRFSAKSCEYRYVAAINNVDEEENDFRVTFLKVCDVNVQTFKIDESDYSDVSSDKIIQKLENSKKFFRAREYFISSLFSLTFFKDNLFYNYVI